MPTEPSSSSRRWGSGSGTLDAVLLASLVPLGVKAIDYALIGSLLPLACWLLGSLLVLTVLTSSRPRRRRLCLIAWASAILLWSLARAGVFVLHLALGIPEAHVAGQMNGLYLLITLAHLGVAVWLLRQASAHFRERAQTETSTGSR